MHKVLVIGVMLSAVTLAGCTGDGPGDGDFDGTAANSTDCQGGFVDDDGVQVVLPSDDVIPVEADGNHSDPWDFATTNYRSCTIEKVGHSPLRWDADGMPDPHNYLGELDMRGDLNLGAIAALGSSETPTVYLLDISDRANPVVLSSLTQAANYIVDVKISDDGDFLFIASQYTANQVPNEETPVPGGPSSPAGFAIYDISDRMAPTYVQTVASPDGAGCHMISHEIIDDTDVIFCVGDAVHAHGLVRATDGAPWAYLGRFTYNLPDGKGGASASPGGCPNEVVLIGEPTEGQTGQNAFCSGPHDMTVGVDSMDGRVLMTVSHWDDGLRVVDASNPVNEQFVTLAAWNGEGATHYDGNVHTAMTFWVGEKRYVVASPEMTYGGIVPSMWILDATDLGDGTEIMQLELVGEWYHPREIPTPGLRATTHQWQVGPVGSDVSVDEVNVYLTMNHWGLWVLDFEAMLAKDMQGAIGGFHMAREPLDPEEEVGNAILATWDVDVEDGYIYGSDRATGLWVFDYLGDVPDDSRISGFA